MIEKPKARCRLQKATWTRRLPRENICNIHPEESSANKERKSNHFRDEEGIASCEKCSSSEDVPLLELNKISRRSSHSDTESLPDSLEMPVETTNSVLKNSFSLTSLCPCTTSDCPDQETRMSLKNDRLYHSLTKQPRQRHRQLEKELWRKSWGSVDGQDDNPLSEAFQANYDYLMSQHILEKDAVEKTSITPTAPLVWSLSELNDNYAQLYSWLSGIRDSISFKEENVADWKSRAERLETLQRQRYRLENFNEESLRLMKRFPHFEPEISHYVKLLNKLWESVESLAGGLKFIDGQRRREEESRESLKNKIRSFRKWMIELKTKLKPLNFQNNWTKSELELLAEEHGVLHRDIEAHSYVISSIVKLCEKVDTSSLVAARALQRKYYEYLLKSFEWKCYIETLQPNKISTIVNDSDGEPGAKKFKVDQDWEFRFNVAVNEVKTDNDPASIRLQSQKEFAEGANSEMVGANIDSAQSHSSADTLFVLEYPSSVARKKPLGSWTGLEETTTATDKSVPPALPRENRNRRLDKTHSAGSCNSPMRAISRKQNTATILCKHTDTEQENSDVEKENHLERNSNADSEVKDAESTSSEDCLTYVSNKENASDMPFPAVRSDFGSGTKPTKYLSAKNVASASWNSRQNSNESIIQELVDRADEMVRCRSTNSLEGRSSRKVKSKGDVTRTLDSYDASSEYTAEESDDLDGSVSTCRRSGSAEGILNDSPNGKPLGVVMRNSRHKNKTRPSSMSCVPSCFGHKINTSGTQLSVSESALNQMSSKESIFGREKKMQWHEDFGGGSGSLRRPRRIRPRKRSILMRKNEADAFHTNGSDTQQVKSSPNKQLANLRGLVKSGSFSGIPPKQGEHGQLRGSDSISGTETDEEVTRLAPPVFKLGPEGGEVTVNSERTKMEGEEHVSLNSDQVDWDDYQEKYQSEAYSEDPPDPDLVKKMTEFGEDYRKYLDSQSECEETRKIIRQKQDKFLPWEAHFGPAFDESDLLSSSAILDETMGTCDKFLHCSDFLEDYDANLMGKFGIAEGLRTVRKKCDPGRANKLKEEISFLRNELRRLARVVDETEAPVTTREELETKIEQLKGKLNSVRELKFKLRPINCSVHRFLLDTGQTGFSLKEELEDLYLIWHNTFEEISSKLCGLQRILQIWIECEELLAQFQCSLPSEQDALQTLELALCESPCRDMGLSLRDVARVLFDKEPSSQVESGTGKSERSLQPPILASLSTEGSLSDSGISDSGSEQGMTEREKKLARLKRLQKLLESILAPGSPGLADMARRIEEAEVELRRLQIKCRELLERAGSAGKEESETAGDAGCMDFRALPAALGLSRNATEFEEEEECEDEEEEEEEEDGEEGERGTGEPEDDPYPCGKSWFWRIVRASLPFHIALVALICVAYLLEPHCCDTLNNLGISLTRQLRNRHPPPT